MNISVWNVTGCKIGCTFSLHMAISTLSSIDNYLFRFVTFVSEKCRKLSASPTSRMLEVQECSHPPVIPA